MADARNQELRARDTDRVDACSMLDAARESGELTSDEHAERTAKAMAAKTFGEIDAILSDLQIPRNLVNSPVVRANRRGPSTRMRVAAAIVVAAALLGAFAGCVSRTTAPEPPLPDPTTGAGLASFVEAYKEHFGDTRVDQVLLYPSYVVIERREDPTSGSDTSIHYDGSFRAGGDAARPKGPDTFDLSTLDIPTLAGLFAGAPRTLGMPNGRIAHVEISHGADGNPEVSIHVEDGTKSGYLTVTAKGEPRSINPPA
ncbi:DUF1707 domain-containing protein [Nocardia sp. ET3-3]|uniref:DUF1707 domain-containing protein n=1 Tax=Nocardia terrae TaxID=2675851 RepID=A0A7K1V0U4_9NOCA|nr:DUF1707 domain-containing protein [Nocardia terrae]MVU80151.1 DUF1707 domain-containing protein [Nocardia terrae]